MTNRNGDADDGARIRDEALSVMRDALEWSLTPAQWSGFAAMLSGMETDRLAEPEQRKALEDVTVQLELAGPPRIEAVDSAAEPAPPVVRERLNVLIDELSKPGEEDSRPGGRR